MSRVTAIVLAVGMTSIAVAVPVLVARAHPATPHRVDVSVQGFTDGQAWHYTPRTIRAGRSVTAAFGEK